MGRASASDTSTFGQCGPLCELLCSLTSCCDLSGESPDDGRFPVRPSSQIPNAAWRQAASKAGTTRCLSRRSEAQLTSLRRSQPGGPGKHTSRSIKRTMQHRKHNPVRYCWQRRALVGGDSLIVRGSLVPDARKTTGERAGPTGVGLAARVDSTAVKVGKVSWVASAPPHSEGAAYKRHGREVAACPRDWRMGS